MPIARDEQGRFVSGPGVSRAPTVSPGGYAGPGGVVRSVDHGYNDLLKRLFAFQNPQIKVGVLEAEGAKSKTVLETATHAARHQTLLSEHLNEIFGQAPARADLSDESLTVIEVAVWNEFGTEDVPARSFIRAWFDENYDKIRDVLRNLLYTVTLGHRTKEQALELAGLWCVGSIQQRIADGIAPENAASTIKAKGSSTPLINSGQMRSSVTHQVLEGGQ